MFSTQADIAALLAEEFVTHIRVALSGAQVVFEVEHQPLAETEEEGVDPSTHKIVWC